MQGILADLRHGARTLLRAPGFTLVAVLTLALGIGPNTIVFSLMNRVLLERLPYVEPDRLVVVRGITDEPGNDGGSVSFTDVQDFRSSSALLEEIATIGRYTPVVPGTDGAERLTGLLVGEGFFRIMRAEAALGRTFTPEEHVDGNDRVVVLTHGLWQSRFGGDPSVIGSTIELNRRPHTIVGVLPPTFAPLPQQVESGPAAFYRPVGETYDEEMRSARHLRAIGRLAPAASLEAAQAEMTAIARRLEREHAESNAGQGVRIVSMRQAVVGDVQPVLLMLFGAVGLVLLIACANVASLLLARSAARHREIAIRAALGASRGRIIRLVLAESLLLSLLGGTLGVLLAVWGTVALEAIGARTLPWLSGVSLDARALLFTAFCCVASSSLFGLAPAAHLASRPALEGLRAAGRVDGGIHARLRNALVVAEIALALVLVIGAGLLIRTLAGLAAVDPGFERRHLLTMDLWLPGAGYPEPAQRIEFFRRAMEQLAVLPGVASAGAVSVLPMGDNFDRVGIAIEGRTIEPGREPSPDRYIVTNEYLRTMGIEVISGRGFTDRDDAGAPPVVLVGETMAGRLWPGSDPIGARIQLPWSPGEENPWRTIVGVVEDVKQYGLDREGTMQIYLPHAQYAWWSMTLVLRTGPPPLTLVESVRRTIHGLDPGLAAFNVATMDQWLTESVALRRLAMILLALFGAVALILSAVGIYGLVSYLAARRRRELGIRIALGARRGDILGLVMRTGIPPVGAGLTLGLLGAVMLTRFLSSLLFGVGPLDVPTLAWVTVLLLAVALAACLLPALRSTRVDPVSSLRCE